MIKILPFILGMLISAIFALRSYFRYRKSLEPAYKYFAPLFLMIAIIGFLAGLFMILFSLGLVK